MRTVLSGFLVLNMCVMSVLAQTGRSWRDSAPVCQILDRPSEPVYRLALGYVPKCDFEGYDDSHMLDLDAEMDWAYFHDVWMGDIDTRFVFDGQLLLSSAGLQLPDQLVALAVDTRWTWRYVNGSALQVRAAPGIYSDIEELAFRSFNMPFSVAGIKTFNPEFSAIVGMELRPAFERFFMPIAGVVWSPADWLRVEATVPEAKAICHVNSLLSAYVGWAWESISYNIREKGDYDRERIAFETYRTSLGVSYVVSRDLRVVGELGTLTERSVKFKRVSDSMDDDIDIDDAVYGRVGIAGPF